MDERGGLTRPDTAAAGLGLAEVGPFLARLARLDPDALVRLRPAGVGAVTLWGRLPWEVLVARTVGGTVDGDLTVPAAALLDRLSAGRDDLPGRRDGDWRWPVPAVPGTAVETVPAADLVRLGAAAAATLRSTRGRVGERVLRDALLDHVAIAVDTGSGAPVEVRQGLVQAVLRMGFVTTEQSGETTIRMARNWVGLAAKYGEAWQQTRANLAVRILR
ncbi:hypothetical protein [Rugosimonospora africana]|uniref:Uncharacterized protein n=1 Tax=Rugosimonospora africana TaxID=556532 RepID=A0A8J3R115_9ACTN|nr:hypothetical protein [Rugosimonospora africana]GIH20236.1 hypothetical protein Raf01_84080 [Rugosimonospora africana]